MSKCHSLSIINLGKDKRFRVKICIRKKWWIPIFFEKFITPQYKVEILNIGDPIENGMIDCDLVEHDDPHSYLSHKKEFINFDTIHLKKFKTKTTLKRDCKIPANIIKPGRFFIRFYVSRFEPDTRSHYEDLLDQMKKYHGEIPSEYLSEEFLTMMEQKIPNFKKSKEGIFRGIGVGDFRWNEKIIVYRLEFLFFILFSIIGITIALLK